MSRRRFLAALGGLGIGLPTLLTGCGDRHPPATVGERVERGGIALTVTEVDRRRDLSQADVMYTPAQGHTFLVVYLMLENLAHDRLAYARSEFWLALADGKEYEPEVAGFLVPGPPDGAIARGETARERVTFEVPTAGKDPVLRYRSAGAREIRVALPSPDQLPEQPGGGVPPRRSRISESEQER